MLEERSEKAIPNSALAALDKLQKGMKNIVSDKEVWLCDTPSPRVYCAGGRLFGGRKIE